MKPSPLFRAAAEFINAVNGLRPLSRHGLAMLPVFVTAWPTKILAQQLLYGSVLDAARRARRGDFAGRRGSAALTLTVASWAMLCVIHRREVMSTTTLHAALSDALGPDYVGSTLSAHKPTNGRPSGVLRTMRVRHEYVEKESTVSYGPHGRANLADIWRRRDLPRDGHSPVVVFVPGGGWVLGWRRAQAYPLLSHLAARGWVCVSLNYRVSPAHTWPDHIVDVKRALAWVKENIAAFGGDQDFVVVIGSSAGGHLAALAALTPNDPSFQPGFPDADTSVAAAVPIYGRYDWYSTEGTGRPELTSFLQKFVVKRRLTEDPQIFIDASPIYRLTPNAPPFFVLHGTDDSVIPVGEARTFVAALRSVSNAAVVYAELRGAQHAFDVVGSPRAHQTAAAIGQFLSWVSAMASGAGQTTTR